MASKKKRKTRKKSSKRRSMKRRVSRGRRSSSRKSSKRGKRRVSRGRRTSSKKGKSRVSRGRRSVSRRGRRSRGRRGNPGTPFSASVESMVFGGGGGSSKKKGKRGGKRHGVKSKVPRKLRGRLLAATKSFKRAKAKGNKLNKRIAKTRMGAIRLRVRSAKGGMSKKQKGFMQKHALARVNPSAEGVAKFGLSIIPDVLAAGAGFLGLGMGGQWVSDEWLGKHAPASVQPFVPALTTAVLTGGVTALARRFEMTKKFSFDILIGGLLAAIAQAFTAKGSSLFTKAAGVGEYVVGEYVVGDYVAMNGGVLDVGGQAVPFDGMGASVAVEGMDASGGILGDAREGWRGRGQDPSVIDVLAAGREVGGEGIF